MIGWLVVAMDLEKDDRIRPTPLFRSTRLCLSVIGFFMFFHLYAQRVAMSVAIVSMVNQTAVTAMAAGMTQVTLWTLLRWILTDDCLANSLTETESVSSSEHFSLLLYLTYWTTVAIAAPTSCSLPLFQLQLIVILILYYNNNNRTIIIVSSRNIFP